MPKLPARGGSFIAGSAAGRSSKPMRVPTVPARSRRPEATSESKAAYSLVARPWEPSSSSSSAAPKPVDPAAAKAAEEAKAKAAETGWGVVFGEDAPTTKSQKAAKKDVAARRKQAKKDGASKAEIQAIKDPDDDQPVWKLMLWALVSGVLLQGLRTAARRGAKTGAERLTTRRPRPNRG